MKKFKNIISLGFNCHVAKDLERLGYRNASYPFDWLISDFCDVVKSVENNFSQWLLLENIVQDEEHKNVYHDRGTEFDFYHDFFPDKEISQQYAAVKEKYCRRIARFQKDCCEPTVFIRFVRNEKDFKYITENSEKILSVLKSFNAENECIYLLLNENLQTYADEKVFFLCTDLLYPLKTSKNVQKYIKKNLNINKWKLFKNKKRYFTKRFNAVKKKFL